MCINSFIDQNPLIIESNSSISDAIALMGNQPQNNPSDCILVVAVKQLIGILTPKDLICSIAQGSDTKATGVDRIMQSPVITANYAQCDDIQLVCSVMQEHSVNHLPILDDDGEILGVISAKSLLSHCSNENWREKELERFFEVTPSLFCIAGFDGYFKRINASFSDILEFSREELFAEPFLNFIHPEDRNATIAEMENIVAGKTAVDFENRYRTKNGEYRWFLWTAKPYETEKVIYAAAQDITERKIAELTLKESEERWQLALRGANDGIWDWNVETNEVFFSRRWKEMLGFSEDEINNNLEGWSKRVHPEDLEWVTELIQEHFAQKTPFYISEHRVLCKDGSYKWILDRGQALWDEAGNVVRMTGSHSDISDRKLMELQLQQERDFSNAIVDTVGALIAVLDSEGKVISFNHTCEQVTGYSFAEIQGKQVWDILIAPEEKIIVQAVFAKLFAGQVPNQYTNHWVAKDGARSLISWSNTALFDTQGKVSFIIATGIDITEQRRVWNKLEHQYRQTKLLAEITRKIRMSIDIREILQTTVTEVHHLLTCDRVLIVKISEKNTAIPIREAVLPDFPSMQDYELVDPLLIGEHLTKYCQGEILAIPDIPNAAIPQEIKQLLKQFQIQAKLVVPILSQKELKGLLVAHQCSSSRKWQKNEIELLTQLADQIGVALSQAQLLDNLESMVKERTIELTTTNQLLQAEIEEREQTEVALRENQRKLAGILDNADEAIISVNEQQQIELFNQGAEKIFGYKATEIMGQPLDILLPEVFREIHRQHIDLFGKSVENSRTMAERNNRVFGLRKNGVEFPAEASISKLRTRKGMLFTVMLKDITQRERTREKLEASQNLLTKAEKIAKIGSWEYSIATQQLSWSEELYEILGFSKNASVPSCKTLLKRIHPEDRFLVINNLKQGHQKGKPWHFHYRFLFPKNQVKYLETRGETTLDEQGKILKIWGTVMDISQRIQAEKSLQRSEEQLRLITDGLPVLIAYIDRQERHIYNNRTYETWFGKSRSAILGLEIKKLFSDADYQRMRPYIETVLSGKKVSFEIQSVNDNGQSFWMSATYLPDFDRKNQVKGFFSMIDDITERKAIEKMKSEFVSVASHEMRTPLTSIHGVVKLLSAGRLGELSPQGKEMADLALRNSDRLVQLVNDILSLERLRLGKDQITQKLCHSRELIQQALDTVETMAQKHNITLQSNDLSLEFWADSDRIIQTLVNLISNAIKFSSDGSQVSINCQQDAENIIFSVTDRGRGIPQDKLETIFERFQQVDASDSRKKGGTGLGLTICRHIVEQHGGKIWAESIYGKGSTFFFTIPQKMSNE